MKIQEIKPGKTYYAKSRQLVRGDNYFVENYRPYFVLSVDLQEKKVLASCGGMPALFYLGPAYSRWLDKLPEDAGQVKSRWQNKD